MYVSTGTLGIERILNVSIQYAALHALYINMLHSSTIITKSSCLTDRHTLWYIIMDHPVCVARVYRICLTM